MLSGIGLIRNASNCYIFTNEIQAPTRILGSLKIEVESPKFYSPKNVSVITDKEAPQLEEIIHTIFQRFSDLTSQITAQWQALDVDSLINHHRTSLRQERRTYWHTVITSGICTISVLIVLFPCPNPFTQFAMLFSQIVSNSDRNS